MNRFKMNRLTGRWPVRRASILVNEVRARASRAGLGEDQGMEALRRVGRGANETISSGLGLAEQLAGLQIASGAVLPLGVLDDLQALLQDLPGPVGITLP